MKPGDKVAIVGKHPHVGTAGTLVSYGPYGLNFLKLTGWLINLDNGEDCYADTKNIVKIK
jgi:hypothetical protein